MLQGCFTHLRGIGPAGVSRLNRAGIYTWDDALRHPELPLRKSVIPDFLRGCAESRQRLALGDALWFSLRLAGAEQWRLFPHFQHSAACVDIETSGLAWPRAEITSIALYDGQKLKVYVQGRDLDDFTEDISAYSLLITWNGRSFDAPFIRRALRVPLRMAHLDLLPVFRSLGLRGGLKKVEKQIGLERGELDGADGYTAVLLWREYVRTGNPAALETLLAYNAADALSLDFLCRYACARHGFPLPPRPEKEASNPFKADVKLLARLRQAQAGMY
ncbi:MAG: ribonuclease H-like domain-containing protein [Deltaproteobacteria bacterium]|nr:ribonuclease H-like domain-containing protein [Deltaproteobacteria bacterium]